MEKAQALATNDFGKEHTLSEYGIKRREDAAGFCIYFYPKTNVIRENGWTTLPQGGDAIYCYEKETCKLLKLEKGQ